MQEESGCVAKGGKKQQKSCSMGCPYQAGKSMAGQQGEELDHLQGWHHQECAQLPD